VIGDRQFDLTSYGIRLSLVTGHSSLITLYERLG
jgi:hypothetical protein